MTCGQLFYVVLCLFLIPGLVIPVMMWAMRAYMNFELSFKAQKNTDVASDTTLPAKSKPFFELWCYTAIFSHLERIVLAAILIPITNQEHAVTMLASYVALKMLSGWGDGKNVKLYGKRLSNEMVRLQRHLSILGSLLSVACAYVSARIIAKTELGKEIVGWFI